MSTADLNANGPTPLNADDPTASTTPATAVDVAPTPPPGRPNSPDGLSEEQAQQLLGVMGRHWGLLLSFGIILAGLGIAIMVWPQATATVVAVLTGISLLVSGVFSLVGSFATPDQGTGSRVLMAISGVLSVGLGLFAFTSTVHALGILAVLVGVGWLIRGIFTLQALPAKGTPGRGLTMTSGILGILAALSILIWPAITLSALIWVTGFWLVVFGAFQVFASFRLRGMSRQAASQPSGTSAA